MLYDKHALSFDALKTKTNRFLYKCYSYTNKKMMFIL